MSIVTKTGDKGTSGLFGGGRVSKAATRLHAYGTVDELNAVLGLALTEPAMPKDLEEHLHELQRFLFLMGADLATPVESTASVPRVRKADVSTIETWITELEPTLPALTRFILPSGSRLGSLLHLARTVCRRAERWIVGLATEETVNPAVLVFLNRLGDFLFLAAREANRAAGKPEEEVETRKEKLT